MQQTSSPSIPLQEREVVQQTFLEKTKRFFSPFWDNSILYLIACFTYFVSALNIAVYILFVEGIIGTLESWNQDRFYMMMFYFIIYYSVYITLKVSMRKMWWPSHSTTARKFVQRIYIPKFVRLDNNYIEKLWTWKIIAIVDKWIVVWWNLFHHFFEHGIRILTSLIFTSYMIWKNSTTLLWIFFLLYVCIYICAYYLNLWTLKYRRKRRDWWNIHTKHLVKIIMSKNEILFTDKTSREVESLDSYFDKETFYNKKMSNFLMPMFELPRIVITWLIVFVLYYFWAKYFAGQLQISEIVWLSTAFIVMLNTINQWTEFFKNFTKDFTDIEKFWNFFDTTPEIQWYDKWDIFTYTSWKIILKDISYGYEKTKFIFEKLNIEISGSKITALVWPSGGWKSTLVKLISGYIRQDSGDIIVDKQNLKEVSLKSYYKDVWYLTQEPSVFDGTVEENLLYAVWDQDINSDKLDEIIQLANCDFIYDLSNGLQTEIWERGVKLSGGQKQRLAIAKIFLKDPKIIILDEPTSALDSISEKKITQAMHNLFKNRTVLVIAHRLQTVKHADDIIVIDQGKVVERGTHRSLVAKKWYYKEMLDLQSGF